MRRGRDVSKRAHDSIIMINDIPRAIEIAHKWISDPKRHPNSERVILARAFIEVAERLAATLENEQEAAE